MTIYTGCVDNGLKQKDLGIRYLTISRLSDNTGLNPREDLWKNDKYDLFDMWVPRLAPLGENVRDWYNDDISWKDFSEKYLDHISSDRNIGFLRDLTSKALEENIVLQCVCPTYENCHRSLLANAVKSVAQKDVEIIHL
tara:strand:- start:80 stop:496 length:417 start_codon:yes stop_codon:yes gene_type:complete